MDKKSPLEFTRSRKRTGTRKSQALYQIVDAYGILVDADQVWFIKGMDTPEDLIKAATSAKQKHTEWKAEV
jgi:hypothetical protein